MAVGLGDVDAGADGGGDGLFDQIHLPGAGLDTCVDDGALLDLSDAGGHADNDPGLEEGHAGHLVNEFLQHFLGHVVVGDDALPQGTDGDDVAGGTAQHGLGLGAHLQQLAGVLVQRHHGGLVQHDALALHIYQNGSGTQIDTDIFCHGHIFHLIDLSVIVVIINGFPRPQSYRLYYTDSFHGLQPYFVKILRDFVTNFCGTPI